jgi:hypothetical protein
VIRRFAPHGAPQPERLDRSKNMTRRPRSHQLETESRTAFSASLPAGWLFRDLAPDYGLDGIVEVFDERGVATGHLFFVQLKATDNASINSSLRVQLDRRTLDYYSTLVLPVLLAVFHSPTWEFYARWVEKLSALREARSTTLRLSVEDKWGSDRCSAILQDLELVRTATEVGSRALRIQRYYHHRRSTNPADKPSGTSHPFQRFSKGERVLHSVFGLGTVNQESENYLFVQFDDDDMARKFNPGDMWEFTKFGNSPVATTV